MLVDKSLVLREQPVEELGPGGISILQGREKRTVISNPVCQVPRLTRGLAGRDYFFLILEPRAAALHPSLRD